MKEELIADLNKILPVVVRVHTEHAPELPEVARLFDAYKAAPSAELAAQLTQATHNFTTPAEACPTFIRAYADLKALVEA